jgi:hypothetical protein
MKVITETYLMKVIPETYLMKVIPETYMMKVIPEKVRSRSKYWKPKQYKGINRIANVS